MRRRVLIFAVVAASLAAFAALPACPPANGQSEAAERVCTAARWGNEKADTLRVNAMLAEVAACGSTDPQGCMLAAAGLMLGTPYGAYTLEGSPERLTVRLDSLDCTTLVDVAAALSRCAAAGTLSWRDFAAALEDMRYRGGMAQGYSSRLHYISEWIADNASRGNLTEVTPEIQGAIPMTKTLDFMSAHRSSYPALSDPSEFDLLLRAEADLRDCAYYYIPKNAIRKALPQLRPGDIIAITTSIGGLDTQHLGIAAMQEGELHLLHASSRRGQVCIDPLPLADYLNSSRTITGIRVVRLRP